ncbi:MAG: hypothetical protein K2O32_06480 [Acetatifactor sp.]|nr:hypothetical protein [Acetatifactor sp.]
MKKTIKNSMGNDIGVAKQVQGQVVEVIPHPKFKGLWQFKAFGEVWMESDYAFKAEEQ